MAKKTNIDHNNEYEVFLLDNAFKDELEVFLLDNGFKKEFPDNMEPKFFWLVKKIKHPLLKDLEINVNLREKIISVFCLDQFFKRRSDQALIIKQKLSKHNSVNKALILSLLELFKVTKNG